MFTTTLYLQGWGKVSSCDIDVSCIVVCKSSPVAVHPIFNIKGNKTFLVEQYSWECECRILWVDRRNGAQWWFWQPLWFGIWKVPPHKLFPCQSKFKSYQAAVKVGIDVKVKVFHSYLAFWICPKNHQFCSYFWITLIFSQIFKK